MSAISIAPYFAFSRVKVTGQILNTDNNAVCIKIEPDFRHKALCNKCGAQGKKIHLFGRRQIRDLNLTEVRVFIDCHYRTIVCPVCKGFRVESLEYVDACKRVTKRLARYIYELCKVLTVKGVAEHLGLDRKTVKEIDKTFLEEEFGLTDYTGLRILAIDEISIRKGHRYLTIVLDYESGRVVWVGKDRDKETLTPFFASMTTEQRARIEAVTLDMWKPYIHSLKKWCPKTKLVFDFFHIVKEFNKSIDKVRNREYRDATDEDKKILKGSKYLLLKNNENLKDEEPSKLKELLNMNRNLSTMYILKDSLKELWRFTDRDQAAKALADWCQLAEESEIKEAKKFTKRLLRYCYGILNHCDYPISTGRLEGSNNKIKVIKRRSYGFHDDQYFILKIKQAFPGKKHQVFWT